MCGLPVRDESATPTIVAAVGFALAAFVYILRMCSALPEGGRELGWDDWTITATLLFTIPPTVFAFLCEYTHMHDAWNPFIASIIYLKQI